MKKITSVILTIIIAISTVVFCIKAPLTAKAEEARLDSFINDTIEMVRKNDKDKDFAVDDKNTASTLSTQSENTESYSFQTCRLIVQAEKGIEKLNSLCIASGFLNYYIVQFETEEDTKKAYEYYLTCNYVISVSPDGVFCTENDYNEVGNSYIEYSCGTPDRLGSWGSVATGTYAVKDYIEAEFDKSVLPEIKVAVIDSGVDLNHRFLQGRLIETGFNASGDGTENSEHSVTNGHGSMVTSTIVDNTLSNVKIANYKVSDDDGVTTTSAVVSAIIKSYSDDSDFINISLRLIFSSDTEYNLINDAVEKAYNSNCMVIVAAGNDDCNIEYNRIIPASNDFVFTVSSSSPLNFPSSFSNTGKAVNVSAPGENIPVAYPNQKYRLVSGTSFSSPLTVSAASLLKTLDNQLSVNQIKVKLESSATELDIEGLKEMWGYGVIDAIGSCGINRAEKPSIHAEESKITISVPDNCEVYYTTNQTYPTKENGVLYTEPFQLNDDIYIIHAVSYSNDTLVSACASEQFKIPTLGTDNMFEISDDGIITAYSGNVNYLSIPETINGIEVSGFAEGLFSEATFSGLVIPETVKLIPNNLLYNNRNIQFVDGYGIEEIGDYSFYCCKNLYSVNFPNLFTIGEESFYSTKQLVGIEFPKCNYIGKNAFNCSSIRSAILPSAEIICYQAFYQCYNLYDIYIPNIIELRRQSYYNNTWNGISSAFREAKLSDVINIEKAEEISYGAFWQAHIKRLEFSNAKVIDTLPITYCKKPIFGTITVVLPATLESCDVDFIPYDEQQDKVEYKIKFRVYGSKDTYAEQWATENGYEFIEITSDNAVFTDIPDEYYSYMRPLEADVVGFNRTYQWYGSNKNNYSDGIAIKGATSRKFDPNEYRSYKYYYCVVTSTDAGYDSIEIKTGICTNKSYIPYTPEKYNASIKISTPSKTYIEFGETVTLYTSSTGLPDGAKIKWRIVDGKGVSLEPSFTGKYCVVTAKSTGNVTIEAYAVNKHGTLIYNTNGKKISDKTGIISEVTLWMIIIDYLRRVFPFIATTFSNLD